MTEILWILGISVAIGLVVWRLLIQHDRECSRIRVGDVVTLGNLLMPGKVVKVDDEFIKIELVVRKHVVNSINGKRAMKAIKDQRFTKDI
jgi:hypothetical protein